MRFFGFWILAVKNSGPGWYQIFSNFGRPGPGGLNPCYFLFVKALGYPMEPKTNEPN